LSTNQKIRIYSIVILSRELLLQGWMKPDREDLAPNVALVSKRFNEVENEKVQLRICLRLSVDVPIGNHRNSQTTDCQWSCSMHRKMEYSR